MSTRMLIDARHSEETRVAIIKGNRVEEFDYESAARRQLKGNIYLAKVMRVEPSLQACFVDYGGNRHGFLAFSEIHPDYYQIPIADREALKSEDAQAAEAAEASEGEEQADDPEVERISGELDYEEMQRRRAGALRRKYKIQEVIKKRQILLVQVVKEERGTKGAALTTYLSLAGRYCVLMPNSPDAGGISRKIANQADRKKLKSLMTALEVPEGMGCIIRTAGQSRTRAEIKRDLDYLIRLWSDIRDLTLKSVAPALIHEEANLIKRSIRDLYTREIDEILVEGEDGYKIAKGFMKLLMPSHARRVQHYKDRIPLFHRFQVEQQLESMYSPLVQLNSGGYIVINPTEALVAIDVNSGRSTREHNIEETALKTNLEAAEEIARQLRLRDMAGLVVIDFIDMEDRGNNRAVEKRLKDALKADRARIQVSRISTFGLIEMTRQRLRPNLLEASMEVCPQCRGTGVVRSTESAALAILRALEEEGIRERSGEITIHAPQAVALYLLNRKRLELADLEQRHSMAILIEADGALDGEPWRMDRVSRAEADAQPAATADTPTIESAARDVANESEASDDDDRRRDRQAEAQSDGRQKKRRPRRRGGRRSRGRDQEDKTEQSAETTQSSTAGTQETSAEAPAGDTADKPARRRRKRRPARQDGSAQAQAASGTEAAEDAEDAEAASGTTGETSQQHSAADEGGAEKPRRRSRGGRGRKRKTESAEPQTADTPAKAETGAESGSQSGAETPDPGAGEAIADAAAEDKPKRPRRRRKTAPKDEAAGTEATPAATPSETAAPKPDEADAKKPTRQRRKTPAKPKAETTEAAAPTEDATVASTEAAAVPTPEPAAPAGESVAETPVERVVVPEDGQPETAPAETPAETGNRRKGWWQRALGK